MNSLGPVLPILESASPPAIDPVCGMTVDPAHAAGSHAHHGTTYFFCSMSCQRQFSAAPDRFVTPQTEHSCCAHQSPETMTALDPVCGMMVVRDKAAGTADQAARMDELRGEGQTVMSLAIDGRLAGMIGVADRIKATTPDAIRALHEAGLRIIMLTGDSRRTADAVAKSLGIDEVIAEVLPSQKLDVVKRLQAEGHVVAMAGDGINDAPALAQTHIGIAMGSGTDVAMESAGITLVNGDLRSLVRALHLSRATMSNIRQNLFLAFVYNVASISVAAGLFYPVFGLLISPVWASVAMSLSSVSVIGNALRLRRIEL